MTLKRESGLFCLLIIALFVNVNSIFSQEKYFFVKDKKEKTSLSKLNDNFSLFSIYLRASFYAENQELEKSLAELEKLEKLDPASIYLKLKKASLLMRLEKFEEAEKTLKEVKLNDSNQIEAYLMLIFLYSFQNKQEEVEREYEDFLKKAHSLRPEDLKIYEELAKFYLYKKDFKKAVSIYEEILKNNPNYLEGFFWLGYIYDEMGKRKEAIELFKQGLKVNNNYPPILNALGYLYAEEGINLQEAESLIKKALEKEPDNPAYLDSLGWVYFRKNNYLLAEEYLLKAIEKEKDPVIYEHCIELYLRLKDKEKALKYYQEAINFFPEDEKLKEKFKDIQDGEKNKVFEKKSK